MPNMVIDSIHLNGWTGDSWQYNFRATSDDNHGPLDCTIVTTSEVAAVINAAIIAEGKAQLEADGSGEIGVGDSKVVIGGATVP